MSWFLSMSREGDDSLRPSSCDLNTHSTDDIEHAAQASAEEGTQVLKSSHTSTVLEPEQGRSSSLRRLASPYLQRCQGWRAGVTASALMTTGVLSLNIVLTLWAGLTFELTDGIGDAYVGDCKIVDTWTLWLHVLINILGSILLGTSSYTMQCITAPTRKECDAAHARGDWLDIGVASFRNLARLPRKRRLTWALLALSSIPIHFLYNSAVFKQLDDNRYEQLVAEPEFILRRNIDFTVFEKLNETHTTRKYQPSSKPSIASQLHDIYWSEASSFDTIDPAKCVDIYSKPILSGHSHVIVITADIGGDSNISTSGRWPSWADVGLDSIAARQTPLHWPCNLYDSNNACNLPNAYKVDTTWYLDHMPFDHCLAKRIKSHCKLQFSVQILVAVMICNCVKIVLMLWVLWHQHEETLVTFGDALASWLDELDYSTEGRCLMGKHEVIQEANIASTNAEIRPPPAIVHLGLQPRCWYKVISRRHWLSVITLCLITIATGAALFGIALRDLALNDYNKIFTEGFGEVRPDFLLDTTLPTNGTNGLFASVLVANTPQVIASLCYLLYNGLFTAMHLSHEYSDYAVERKSLRVTTPRGEQRSTYWLQLPFKYGIPLVIASGVLHWLISQSIFLARVATRWDGVGSGRLVMAGEKSNQSALGISLAPMLASVLLALCLLVAVIGLGFRRLRSNMPVAGSCSLALAAAAHRPKEDVDASRMAVMWGEVMAAEGRLVGHCSFTSQNVVKPVSGRVYAGIRNDGNEVNPGT